MQIEQFIKPNDKKSIKLMRIDLENQQYKSSTFTNFESNLLDRYAYQLGYFLSRNKQNKTIKLFNPITKKYGFIQKFGTSLFYGYFDKIQDNSIFVKKYPINDILGLFNRLDSSRNYEPRRDMFVITMGLIDLEY